MNGRCQLQVIGGLCCRDICQGKECKYFVPETSVCPYEESVICNASGKPECEPDCFFKRKPPIGLTPRYIHDGKRLDDVKKAITRYTRVNMEIPAEWAKEYNDLIKSINQQRKGGD